MNSSIGADDKTVIYTGGLPPSAKLVCLDVMLDESLHDLDITLGTQDETLGRGDNNSFPIKFNKVSRNHAQITYANQQWIIEDLNSANGTYINEQVIKKAAMGQGDIVVIGQVPFRFEIKRSSPAPAAPAKMPEPSNDYVGDSGTMYAQHVGVIEQLAKSDEAEEDLPPPVTPIKSAPASPAAHPGYSAPQANKKSGGKFKFLFLLLFILGGVGGFMYWEKNKQSREVHRLYVSYSKNIQRFLENYESVSNKRTPSNTLDLEKEQLRKITARVEVALSEFKNHEGLKDLKKRLLFLMFERDLLNYIRSANYYDAGNLVENTRAEIDAIILNRSTSTHNFDGLIDLADIAVRFKRFSEQYPDPKPDATRSPDEYELRKMREVKVRFIERKKANYLLLSVTYSRFHELLERIEKEDIRLLNRWEELVKRGSE